MFWGRPQPRRALALGASWRYGCGRANEIRVRGQGWGGGGEGVGRGPGGEFSARNFGGWGGIVDASVGGRGGLMGQKVGH